MDASEKDLEYISISSEIINFDFLFVNFAFLHKCETYDRQVNLYTEYIDSKIILRLLNKKVAILEDTSADIAQHSLFDTYLQHLP